MTPQLISVSRRTDIPAFYGDWFMRRVAEGFAGWENPFGGQRQLVSLRREDVWCLAFWSKNFRPFLPHLRTLQKQGYPCFFNYTITGLPSIFETLVVPAADAVDSLRELAGQFSPEHINWRYDPIILSEHTPPEYHLARFAELATALHGCVTRCIVSFVWRYSKVERNFAALEQARNFRIFDPDVAARRQLAEQLAALAAKHNIALYSCCGDYLGNNQIILPLFQENGSRGRSPSSSNTNGLISHGGRASSQAADSLPHPIHKAHCLDGETISRLYYGGGRHPSSKRPTRPECGCAGSVDIGRYDSCPHGCIYCYATANKARATACHQKHDPAAAFLGRSKEDSDRLVQRHQ